MSFRALVVDKSDDGVITTGIRQLEDAALPGGGDVVVDVDYSTLNYKDGLCLTGGGGLVRSYPHVPGIDFAGTVASSDDARYRAGDKVVLTGWRVGEVWWGGYAEKAKVKADWLVPLPEGLSAREAMGVGTAGLAAMLAIMALEEHGLAPECGPVLVTGASGGVGSIATAVLAARGYEVAAVTGRPESEAYLKELGAQRIVPRAELAEVSKRPLESESWAGAIDNVGGAMLARLLGQMKYGASVAAVGLAGGVQLPTTVIPFLLRGVNLLGIDSVMQPLARRQAAWRRIASDLPRAKLESMIRPVQLADVAALGPAILKGEVRGRVVFQMTR